MLDENPEYIAENKQVGKLEWKFAKDKVWRAIRYKNKKKCLYCLYATICEVK